MNNISKIISAIFLSLSILLLCYVFYRSQIMHSGNILNYYQKYYIVAFLFIIFSFISFFIPKELKINITIVFISTLIGLYLIEGYLNIKNSAWVQCRQVGGCVWLKEDDNRFVIYKNDTGKDYDQRTKFQIYQDLKKKDPSIIATPISSVEFRDKNSNFLPLSGPSNRKMIHCNENGYYSIYQSDRYGFNNPDEEWDKDEIGFFLVGDSFTHGHCVNEPDTISGNLRKLNNNKKGVLNLGQDNNGPLIEYATLREYLPVKKVKRVLWLYYEGNDLQDLNNELNHKILLNYLNDKKFTQNLILRKKEIEKFLLKIYKQERLKKERLKQERFLELIKFVKLYSTRKIIFSVYSIFYSDFAPTKEFENILKLSIKLTKENNSILYFVYLPDYERYIGKNIHDNKFHYKKVTKIVENLNIPIIDIHKELFEKHNDPLSLYPFRLRYHYNEPGYQLVSETIFNKIQEFEK